MEYILDGVQYAVQIVRKNNKNTYVRVKEGNIIYVTTSIFMTKKQILKILDNNQKFLRKQVVKNVKKQTDENSIRLLGETYDLIISDVFKKVEIVNNKIYAKNKKDFDKWYLIKTKELFTERYEYYYKKFLEDIPYFSLKFRSMKTRWGVCNRKSRTITLNTKLLEYPVCCLDYVIVHELSHLVVFNHSASFWKVVEKYYPDYKRVRKILKD